MQPWTHGNPHWKSVHHYTDRLRRTTEITFEFSDIFVASISGKPETYLLNYMFRNEDYKSKPAGKWRKFQRRSNG